MAFTQVQLQAVEKAIASGTTRVRYADREVQYRTLDELLQLRTAMKSELGLIEHGGIAIQYPSYSKGLS